MDFSITNRVHGLRQRADQLYWEALEWEREGRDTIATSYYKHSEEVRQQANLLAATIKG
jgi:hypothetical protein